jgi:plastocyanin
MNRLKSSLLGKTTCGLLALLLLITALGYLVRQDACATEVYTQPFEFREMQPYGIEVQPSADEFGVYDYVKEGIVKLMVFSPEEMYGISVYGSLVSYIGNDKWMPVFSGYKSDEYNFSDIWGSSARNTYLINNNGLYCYNGLNLALVEGVENPARVWGTSGGDVYVIRSDAGLYHYDGSAWSLVDCFSGKKVNCVGGLSANSIYAGTAEGLYYFDGSGWAQAVSGKAATCIGKTADNKIIACYGREVTWQSEPGGPWTSLGYAPMMPSKIEGTALNDLYAVMGDQLYLRKNDGNWYMIKRADGSQLAAAVRDFHVFSRRDFLVVGLDNPYIGCYFTTPILYHYDGTPTIPPPDVVYSDREVTAYLRVEGYDHTIIPRTQVTLKRFGLGKAGGAYLNPATGSSANPFSEGWGIERFEEGPTALHILLKALMDNGYSKHDPSAEDGLDEFDVQDYGWSLYVAMIGGDREFDRGSMSGWLYRVNGWLPNYGSQAYALEDGDEVVWYYSASGFDSWYTDFKADREEINAGETVNFTLNGETTDLSGASGVGETVVQPIANATLLVDGQPYQVGGQTLQTDAEGKAAITFDMPGTYEVSCEGWDVFGEDSAVRPASITITVSGSAPDLTPPEFDSGYPKAEEIAAAGFNLKLKQNEAGTAYYKVVASGTAPGTDYADWASVVISGTDEVIETVNGLIPGQAYDVYVIAKDTSGNLQAEPVKLEVTTASGVDEINIQISIGDSGMVTLQIATEYPDEPVMLLVTSGSNRYYIDQFKTDGEGKASISFSLPLGKEYLGVVAINDVKKEFGINLNVDTKAPVITTDLEDKTVTVSEMAFTASATDDVDGAVPITVKVNDEIATGVNGFYTVQLNEGENIIVLEAEDSAGNKATESFTVTYNAAQQFTVYILDTPDYFNLGEDADVTAVATNNSDQAQDILLVIALYNDQNMMINYTYSAKSVAPGTVERLTSGFRIPAEGNYQVKAFVWENWESIKPLSNVAVIPVQ